MTFHFHFPRNTKILVIMNDGSRFVDRFLERKSTNWILKERGKFNYSDVRSATIFRGKDDDGLFSKPRQE